MRQLYYTLQTLIHGKGISILKIISLTLGIFISVLLLAKVAFELSYDCHYYRADNLYGISASMVIDNNKRTSEIIIGPLAGKIAELFPEQIESSTTIRREGRVPFYRDDHRVGNLRTIFADSAYFRTMGIEVITGDTEELRGVSSAFISGKLADQIFGKESPLGEVLLLNKNLPVTIRGVYKDIPENSTILHDIVVSFPTLTTHFGLHYGWNGGDSYQGFIRFKDKKSVAETESRLPDFVTTYMPDWKEVLQYELFLEPVVKKHIRNPDVKRMVWIMAVLAIVILFITSLNYVLIVVASLSVRAKAVGVHKSNGATAGDIYKMFLGETGVVIGVALLLVYLLMINFRDAVEGLVSVSLPSLFTWQTLWAPLIALLLLFLIAGFLPATLFSSIPVTQIFGRYTNRKAFWKRPLLFVQFAGISFILGLLMVIWVQYRNVLNKDVGYDPTHLVYFYVRGEEGMTVEHLKEELNRLPFVKSVGVVDIEIVAGYSGIPVYQDGKLLFTGRQVTGDFDYLSTMEINLVEGRNFDGPGQVIVSETYVQKMNWHDGAVGKVITDYGGAHRGRIVGVMKDVEVHAYKEKEPIVLYGKRNMEGGCIYIRVYELTEEVKQMLREKISGFYPAQEIRISSQEDTNFEIYSSVRSFRDSVVLSAIAILLITLVGLLGYVNDEIRRRSKEIAVRKVNGARTTDILRLLSVDVLWIAFPATLTGIILSYFIGNKWMEQFHDQVLPAIPAYLGLLLGILLLITAIVTLKVYRIATENPVDSIKSE